MNAHSLMRRRAAIKPDTLVVGIDVAKFSHVARAVLPGGAVTRPFVFANSQEGFLSLQAQLTAWKPVVTSAVIVGLESSGVYWINLAGWLTEHGCQVVQVSGLHVYRVKELLDNSRGTSDGKDALLIADLVAQGKFLGFVRPAGVHADLRALVRLRLRLKQEHSARCSLMHQSVDLLFPEFAAVFRDITLLSARRVIERFPTPAAVLAHTPDEMHRELKGGGVRIGGKKLIALAAAARQSIGVREGTAGLVVALKDTLGELDSLEARLRVIEAEIRRLLAEIDETAILTSVPRMGAMTVAAIQAETGGLRQYSCAAAVLKLAGLNLYQISSGQYRGERHISRRGQPLLRHALYFAVLQHTRPGAPLYPYYAELIRRGKPRLVALVALCCRLVRLLFALVRDGRRYSALPPVGTGQAVTA